jgi:hypothetical protein
MYRCAQHLFVTGLALVSLATVYGSENGKSRTSSEALDLQPFTNVAYIPEDADPSSFHFESIKRVSIPTRSLSTADPRACDQAALEPGGSMFCPFVQFIAPAPAYRITFSFTGQPMASDEYANPHFTFSVYLHPEELSATVRRAVDERRLGRDEAASLFKLSTSRELVRRVALDEPNSTRCEGTYIDGSWTLRDQACEDKLAYRTVSAPSSFLTVKVDLAGTSLSKR